MKNKSFTLIELLLVISIIGLLTLVIVSGLRSTTDRAKIARTLQYQASLHRQLGSDIKGWWNFNDSASPYKDISGYNNNGSCTACPTSVDGVPGTGGSARSFNGSSYVTIGAPLELQITKSITLTGWFQNKSLNNEGTIIGKMGPSSETRGTRVRINSSNKAEFTISPNGSTILNFSTDQIITENDWYHVVGLYDSENQVVKIYLNGKLDKLWDTEIPSSQFTDDIVPWQIGARGDDSQRWQGFLDDVRIYNTALTSEEIQRIYTETKDKYIAEEK